MDLLAALLLVVVTAAVVGGVVRVVVARQGEASRDATVRAAVDTVYALAGDKLGDQLAAGSRELDHTGRVISEQVAGMAGELSQVRDLVAALQRERADQQGRLEAQLEEAARRSADLADVTGSLRQALASPQARGQWGERMADDVLARAGFVEGVNFRKRRATDAGTIPDFTFLLPDGDQLHMDVKFPASAYLRYLEAEADTDREQHRRQFVRDVRDRVNELTGRDYADPRTTPGYLLLFIPNEAVYSFLHEQDPDVLDHALDRRVVLCSPSTLFAVLAVVRQAIDHFRLERASDEILECLGGFTRQWEKFSDQLDKVGRQLDQSQRSFADLAGTRRNQLQRAVDAVVDLRERKGLDELGGGTGGGAGPAAGVPHLHEVRGA
ncbi:MAG: DNA recombination protein RmuC [Acidimicrobiales bacterium]|nr:DNA recombination protein RmuC [Acidimicrobiales bacterium]MCB9373227.1 DNA recombination protein RmuC [Microthrixaceae bacterium]